MPVKNLDVTQTSNGAKEAIDVSQPYRATVTIQGVAPLLFHAWNAESIEEKANASKNSKTKKTGHNQ